MVKKHSVTKNCYGPSLFEYIVLEISEILQIIGLQPQISKAFLDRNFGKKYHFLKWGSFLSENRLLFIAQKKGKCGFLDRSRFAPKSCVCKVFDILRAKNISAQGRRKL